VHDGWLMVLSETNSCAGRGSARQVRKARSGRHLLAFSRHAVGKRDKLTSQVQSGSRPGNLRHAYQSLSIVATVFLSGWKSR